MLSTDLRIRDVDESALSAGRVKLHYALEAIGVGTRGSKSSAATRTASAPSEGHLRRA